MQAKYAPQRQCDPSLQCVMPVAYENYLLRLDEKQREVNRNLIPINLAIKRYKSQYRNLCAYRLKKKKSVI